MRYKAKADLWIKLMMWVLTLMYIPIIAFAKDSEEIVVFVITTIVMALICLPLIYWSYYELREDYLFIRMSLFTAKIRYEKIKSLKLCSNWRSSMALGKERIEIKEHNKGFVRGTTYISPEDREVFYDELVRQCKNLEFRD